MHPKAFHKPTGMPWYWYSMHHFTCSQSPRANQELARAQVATLRMRKADTKFKWVKGHSPDNLAKGGALKQSVHKINLTIPPELRLTGAKLTTVTQSLAYKAIRRKKMKKSLQKRRRTEINIFRFRFSTKAEMEATYNRIPTEAHLWKSMQHPDFSHEVRVFMSKTMHDAFMVGDKWSRENNPDDLQGRSEWQKCQETEYILCDCAEAGQADIWALTEKLWSRKKTKMA
ncbi:hypothetical protein B0H11DRAFT_2401804 [Mycena galericulata]|nr:hypothetical protein B0H11DRAFT_2401804 [Mycena galericulata]